MQQTNILEYFDETIKKYPDKTAFANEDFEMTFSEVYKQSRGIGTFLFNNGYTHEPVVIFMEKHPKMITAFFGTVYGGCYYVPIDAEMPETRIELIFKKLTPRVIICDDTTYEQAQSFSFEGKIYKYDDIADTEPDDNILSDIRLKALDTDPIYIVFTSGSTGMPKGVVACHRSVIDYIENLSDVLKFNNETVFANQTPLYFDACLKELYPTLKFGATTYLVPKSYFMFPVKLVEFLNEKKINTVCWVVSALTMISAFNTFKTVTPKYLHTIAFGSEVFPIKQFRKWKEVLPEARFINLYGPTECTGMCCYYEVNREFELDEHIPVGGPFKNTEILLLKDDNTLAGEGEEGEICVRGTSLTLGYYRDFEKTNEVFVQNPLNDRYPELIYRTGDIGKLNSRGELMFVSRKDYQIKHMGHRIELGEIEFNVNMLDGITSCGAIYDKKKEKIVLYYAGDIESPELVSMLKDKLPRYMIPNKVIKLDNMPLTPNGKLDRKKLQAEYENNKSK